MLQRALRLRSPQLVSRHLHYAQAVGLPANIGHADRLTRHIFTSACARVLLAGRFISAEMPALGHVPKKLPGFFDEDMLQLFDLKLCP